MKNKDLGHNANKVDRYISDYYYGNYQDNGQYIGHVR
jgi:hypothetical protein